MFLTLLLQCPGLIATLSNVSHPPSSVSHPTHNRLLQCGLTTLETRRLRGDQIEAFKIVNGYEDVDRNMFFKLKEGSRTRGHKAALVKEQCRLDMRKYSFSQRVIN